MSGGTGRASGGAGVMKALAPNPRVPFVALMMGEMGEHRRLLTCARMFGVLAEIAAEGHDHKARDPARDALAERGLAWMIRPTRKPLTES